LWCPEHGARTEGVPFARPGAEFTRDLECLVAWLMTRTDKSTVKRLLRIDWDTVGRIVKRVCDDELDPDRLNDLFDVGIDEVSWKRQHNYLTLVADHQRRQVVWGCEGNGQAAADRFFDELDPPPPPPEPEAVRGIFEPGLDIDDVTILIGRLLSRLARCRLAPVVKLGKTIRKHRDGILAAIGLGINQGRTEALNNKVRLITRRAYGFHCAKAALALILLTCGPITLHLPHELHTLGIG